MNETTPCPNPEADIREAEAALNRPPKPTQATLPGIPPPVARRYSQATILLMVEVTEDEIARASEFLIETDNPYLILPRMTAEKLVARVVRAWIASQ